MDEVLAAELIQMGEADQRVRGQMARGEEWDPAIDRENARRLREIVQREGWPAAAKVGREASRAAWLVVQHIDDDPEFQAQCLDKMKRLPVGEVEPEDTAYLVDRVRVNQGDPQLYGTQFYRDESGTFRARPIEDHDNLDGRRSEVGLEPFAEYERSMLEKYGTQS